MKKFRKVLLLTGVLTGLLCVSAMAAEEQSGICDVTASEGYTLTVDGSTTTVGDKQVYVGAEKLTLTTTNPTAGEQYLVLALSGDSATPTEANIVYIDQNDNGSFTVYPKTLTAGTYKVYLYSTTTGIGKVGSFGYYTSAPAYTLGDVNGDNDINSKDALLALQHSVSQITLENTKKLAADVNEDGDVNSKDALQMLQYSVKQITEFHK